MNSPVADFLSRLLAELNAGNDLLLGEAIRKFAFDDRVVRAARGDLEKYNRTKKQIAAFNGIFNRGFYLWPMHLTAGRLDSLFRPAILHDVEVTWARPSTEVELAFEHIGACFSEMMEALRCNRIAVVDMDNNPIHSSLWRRPRITIHLETSDLYEIGMEHWSRENPNNGLLRRGLRLSLPLASAGAPIASASTATSLETHPNIRHDKSKHDGTTSKAAAQERCTAWLIGEMKKSPKHRPKPKDDYWNEARKLFHGLSERSFVKAWSDAASTTGAKWSAPGRPKSVR
jgi:hypothetical protein